MPVRLAVTAGTVADCSQALPLIEGIKAEHLLADKAYDTNEIVAGASARGMNPVIPPKSNRKEKRDYDRALYKLRHLVENGFLEFKQWRGVATRYAKNSLSYLDFTQNPGKVMDDITFVRSHWWLVSEGFSLSTTNSDVQKLPATLYHRIADSLAYAA